MSADQVGAGSRVGDHLGPGARAITLSLLLLGLATALPGQAVPAPTFRDGDLAAVKCTASQVKSEAIGTTRLLVEVDNRSDHAFEPTLFLLRWTDAAGKECTAEVARVPLPRVQRVGRLVPPRKKLSYPLQFAASAVKKVDVQVREGLFSDAAAAADNPVRVASVRRDTGRAAEGTQPESLLELHNALDQPVDVVLRAKCSAPKDGEVLLTVQLPAKARGEVRFQYMPMQLEWASARGSYAGIHVDKAEVVDWSVRLPADAAAGALLLLPAYRAWWRWSDPGPGLRGRFLVKDSGSMRPAMSGTGTFTIAPNGEVRTESESNEAANLAKRRIESALLDLRRPTPEKLAADNVIEVAAKGVVEVRGRGWNNHASAQGQATTIRKDGSTDSGSVGAQHPLYRIRDGRIVSEGRADAPEAETWQTRSIGDRYVVTQRSSNSGKTVEHFGHQLLGEVVVPTRYQRLQYDAADKVLLDDLLVLEDVSLAADVRAEQLPVPTGPAADALRALWDRVYHYPGKPVQWTARFKVTTPGTDLIWVGQKKVEGTLDCRGFIGFSWTGPAWERCDIAIERSPSPDATPALAAAFRDRLVMWKGRDLSGFGDFDRRFRGTTIEHDEVKGLFRIQDSPLREVRVREGKVHSVLTGSGIELVYTWQELEGRLVATKVRSGEETITAKWSKVGEGWYLPVWVEFRAVFGKDWGPETMEFSQISVR